MPDDRSLLLVSAVLQATVALTFGLAFWGLWRGFRRSSAFRWATAWLTFAGGAAGTIISLRIRESGGGWPLLQLILVPLLFAGILLFRAGTDALAAPDRVPRVRSYVLACVIVVGGFIGLGFIWMRWLMGVNPAIFPYVIPRFVMGGAWLWAAWPLFHSLKERWSEGYALLAGAMVLLSLRTFSAGGYDLWTIVQGVDRRPESPILTIAQVSLLIVFGVATALVLMARERAEALHAADTIRLTAEALRESERQFRFVVEHSSDVQVLVDDGRRVQYVAPSCERLLGRPPSDFERQDFLTLVHEDDRRAAREAFEGMQADDSRHRPPTSVRIRHQSGEWRTFEVTGTVAAPSGSDGPAFVLSARDVTTQRRLEQAVLRSQRLDSLGQMAGAIAHDFNNTLSAIVVGLDLARDSVPAGTPVSGLDVIEQASNQGVALTRQLLAFARQAPEALIRFDVAERIASIENMLRMVVGRRVQLEVSGSGQPLHVRANPTQFEQVIVNLAVNARDAMPAGGKITISVAQVPPAGGGDSIPRTPGRLVRVTVQDTGAGIPPAILDRLFEPFFTTKEPGRGTGLGLATAYGFARQAGGTLSVESTEGVGTIVRLELPLDRATVPNEAATEPSGSRESAVSPNP